MPVRHPGQTRVNRRKACSTPKRREDAAADNGKSGTMCLSLQTLNTATRGVMQSPLKVLLCSASCAYGNTGKCRHTSFLQWCVGCGGTELTCGCGPGKCPFSPTCPKDMERAVAKQKHKMAAVLSIQTLLAPEGAQPGTCTTGRLWKFTGNSTWETPLSRKAPFARVYNWVNSKSCCRTSVNY